MADRLDILIFGATGFTGIHCIPYVHKHSKENGRNLSWGVAGRSEEKLKKALKQMGEKLESNFDAIPIVVANVDDHESLVNMAKKAKVVINCCGPYRFFGDAVVEACIEAGTHHVDVSGEPEYMERIQAEKHDAAQEKGVYVISACGLDSIPADLGIIFVQQNFEGTLNSVETYIKSWTEGPAKGPLINYGTWESAVQSIANRGELRQIRKKLNEKFKNTPTFPPKVLTKTLPHKPLADVDGWAVPFLGSDRSVARRSQGYLYENENIRPVQVATYMVVPSALILFGMFLLAVVFGILTRFKAGTRWLLNYPEIFSAGFFSKKAPSEETIQNTWFSIDFYGEGWKEKLADKDDQYSTPVDKFIKARVTGQNPGYGSTCLALVLAGITVIAETDKLANKGKGGVYPPGAAFSKTSIVKQLIENGMKFEILSQGDIKQDN